MADHWRQNTITFNIQYDVASIFHNFLFATYFQADPTELYRSSVRIVEKKNRKMPKIAFKFRLKLLTICRFA